MNILATYRTKPDAIGIPVLQAVKRSHLNLDVLRRHPKWSGLSNSDMMPQIVGGLLRRAAKDGRRFLADALPENVRVRPDASGFMVTVELLG
jgi:hypothetical protein